MIAFQPEDSLEVTMETPAERAVRFKDEEDELEQLLLANDVSGDAAELLIDDLARKHEFETKNNAIVSMEEFQEIEKISAVRTSPTALEDTIQAEEVQSPKTTEPPVGIVHVSPEASLAEVDSLRNLFGVIIDAKSTKEQAHQDLNVDNDVRFSITRGLTNLKSKLEVAQKLPEGEAKEKQLKILNGKIADVERQKVSALRKLTESDAVLKESIAEATSRLDTLPPEIAEAIRKSSEGDPSVNSVFKQHNLNAEVARMIAYELGHERRDAEFAAIIASGIDAGILAEQQATQAQKSMDDKKVNPKVVSTAPFVLKEISEKPAPHQADNTSSGVFDIQGNKIFDAKSGMAVVIPPPLLSQLEESLETTPRSPIVFRAGSLDPHPDDRLTPEHMRISEEEALAKIMRAGATRKIVYEPVNHKENTTLTGLYVEGDNGIESVHTLPDGTTAVAKVELAPTVEKKNTKEPLDLVNLSWEELDALLVSTNPVIKQKAKNEWQGREKRALKFASEKDQGTFGALTNTLQAIEAGHGGTVAARWLLAFAEVPAVARYLKAHPVMERPEIVNLKEINIEERFNRAHGFVTPESSLEPGEANPVIPVPQLRKTVKIEQDKNQEDEAKSEPANDPEINKESKLEKKTYTLSFLTGGGEEMEMRAGMMFAYLTPEEIRAFNEISAISKNDKNLDYKRIRLMEHQESEGQEVSAVPYLCAFEGPRLTHHIRVSMTPTPGAILFTDGKIAGEVKEVFTPEAKARKVKEKAKEAEEAQFTAVVTAGAEAYRTQKANEMARLREEARVQAEELATKSASQNPTNAVSPQIENVIPGLESTSSYDKAVEENWDTETMKKFAEIPKNWTLSPIKKGAVSAEAAPKNKIELNDIGSLWASFIEREYGIDVNEDVASELSEAETTAHSAELASVVVNPEAPTPTPDLPAQKAGEVAPKGVNTEVAKLFEAKFGVQESELGMLPVFRDLTPEKQLLVLRNLEQATFTNIKKEARETQEKEWGNTGWFKKGLQSLVFRPARRIAELEKELLAKSQGVNDNRIDDMRRLSLKLGHIESLAKVAEEGPDVTVENGEMTIGYVTKKDLFGSLEDKKLTGEHLLALEGFNKTATAYAKIPHDWQYETTTLNQKERKMLERSKNDFESARATLLEVFAKKFADDGVEKPEERAMLQMNALDERVAMNQLCNAHPDAETALLNIERTPAWKIAAKEFMKAKGTFIMYGSLARGAVVMTAGALAVPTLGASLAALGVGVASYGAAVGVGYGVGHKIGKTEGEKLMKAKRVSGRMSEEDEREEIEYFVPALDAEKKIVNNEAGEVVMEAKTRMIKEFTDSVFFTDRLGRLSAKLEQSTDAKEKELLEKKIAQTTMLMASKFRKGMINFGGSSLETGDTRKGKILGNQLSFLQALHRGALTTMVDREKMKEEVDRLMGLRQSTIEEKRKETIRSTAVTAARFRAGFAVTGATLGHWLGEMFSPSAVDSQLNALRINPEKTIEGAESMVDFPEEIKPEVKTPTKTVSPIPPAPPLPHQVSVESATTSPSSTPRVVETPQKSAPLPATSAIPKLRNPLYAITDQHKASVEPKPVILNPKTRESFLIPGGPAAYVSTPADRVGQSAYFQGNPRAPGVRVPQNLSSAPAPVIPGAEEVTHLTGLFEKIAGRPLSSTEFDVVRNLMNYGANTKDFGELAKIGAFKQELAAMMKQQTTPISPKEIYEILIHHKLETKVTVPRD